MVKNQFPEDVQTCFTNKHVVDQQIVRAHNKEEIINIVSIPADLIYYGLKKIKNRCYHGRRKAYGQHRSIGYALVCAAISLFLHDWKVGTEKCQTPLTASMFLWNSLHRCKTVGKSTIQPTLPYAACGNGRTAGSCNYSASKTASNPTADTSAANEYSRYPSVPDLCIENLSTPVTINSNSRGGHTSKCTGK